MSGFPKVIKETVNVGKLPYISSMVAKLPVIEFHEDLWVEKFPRINSIKRVTDALEMNLYLERRYTGQYQVKSNKKQGIKHGGATLKTISSIANSLVVFLKWIEKEDIDWREVYAYSENDRAKYWLPVYRYRKYLIDKVKERTLEHSTASTYINHVRQFYEWARSTRRIEKLPFKYITKIIKKRRKDNEFDYLHTAIPHLEKGYTVNTSDLAIPVKHKPKSESKQKLKPLNDKSIDLVYSSKLLKELNYEIWCDCGLKVGLRADEIAGLESSNICDPGFSEDAIFWITVEGKFSKRRSVMIPKPLMTKMWNYLNSDLSVTRRQKWQAREGNLNSAPLFLNQSGKRLNTKSISNIFSSIRAELKATGRKLKHKFHDLRATFATRLAALMLSKNLPVNFIKRKLMELLGHENFSQTQKYINFAREVSFDKKMQSWVDRLYPNLSMDIVSESRDQGVAVHGQ